MDPQVTTSGNVVVGFYSIQVRVALSINMTAARMTDHLPL